MSSLTIVSKEYLRSLSPLAQKIGEDVDAAQEAYQDLWHTLKFKEQQQVLDETIIDPAAVLKYAEYNKQNLQLYEDFKNNFSWFTKSQLNLFTNINVRNEKLKKMESFSSSTVSPTKTSMIDVSLNESKSKSQSDPSKLLNKLKSKVYILKSSTISDEKRNLIDNKLPVNILSKGTVSKPKTPPPPPPMRCSEQTEKSALLSSDIELNFGDNIPKTGFDFLDNW
uniref:DUF4706 domain-containing protein n=1 Tax=Clastoptera arizonana TaxID=38151 RepID=A0A1B6CAI6_9HEMI